MSASDRLISREQMADKLYDAESLMQIKSSVANGYVVLLSNGANSPQNGKKKRKKSPKKKKKEDNSLAFMALTSGNVLDACFGVQQANRRGNSPSRRKAQAAKDLLDASATTESFRDVAVEAYCTAFKIAIAHDEQMRKLNCFTRCFRSKRIRNSTEKNLSSAFSQLSKAVGESR